MLAWASPMDTLVAKSENADLLRSRVDQAGGSVTVISTVGDHGDSSNFQADRLLAFFDGAVPP